MNSSRHLKILALILALIGICVTSYQIFVLKTPLEESQSADLWTIDARITMQVKGGKPVDLSFYLPPHGQGFDITNELFIANGYGQSIFDSGENRLAQWTARNRSGRQTIFYRFNLSRAVQSQDVTPGETWCPAIEMNESEKLAADALLSDIRQKSADTGSFITTAINALQDTQDNNVKLLLGIKAKVEVTPEKRFTVLKQMLSQAHIPVEAAHVVKLVQGVPPEPEIWARSFIKSGKSSTGKWRYFNLNTSAQGLPRDSLVWWVGDEPLLKTNPAFKPQVSFSIAKDELTARSLEKLAGTGDFSLYSLPIATQFAYKLMLMIPFGVFITLLLRNIVGIETLGTFTPVLIALAFRETGLTVGIVFFCIIVSIGLLLRGYLEQLKLQMLPRLGVVLSCVIMLIIASSMLCHKLGFTRGLSVTLFPMVILTMSIERLSITWEERGGANAFKVIIGTLVAASLVYLVLNIERLSYFVFTFPASLLVLIVIMLGIGRYRGYRLSELFRFRSLINKG